MSGYDEKAEQQEFEEWIMDDGLGYDEPSLLLERNALGQYASVKVLAMWYGWRQRAWFEHHKKSNAEAHPTHCREGNSDE